MSTTKTKRTSKQRRLTRIQRQREAFVSSLGPDAVHVRENFDEWDGSGLEIDETNHVIRNVKVIGNKAKNRGREYPQRVLEAAAPKYNGKQVNINHPKRGEEHRDLNDRFGWIDNVGPRSGKPGLYGDLHYNPHHERAPKILWFAKHNPKMLGLSPDHWFREVDGKGQPIPAEMAKRYDGPRSVSEILHVHSVDLVADPSTTDSLQEACSMEETELAPETGVATEGMDSTDHLREHCCKMIEEALASIDDPDTLRKASAKLEALAAKLAGGGGEEEEEAESEEEEKPEEKADEKEEAMKEEEALRRSTDPAIKALMKRLDAQNVREAATRKELDDMKAAKAKEELDAKKRDKAVQRCKEASALPEFASAFFLDELVGADEKRWDAMISDRKAIIGARKGPASHAREGFEFGGNKQKQTETAKPKTLEERKAEIAKLAANVLSGAR